MVRIPSAGGGGWGKLTQGKLWGHNSVQCEGSWHQLNWGWLVGRQVERTKSQNVIEINCQVHLFPDHERIFILKRQESRSKGSVPVTTYCIPSYTCYLLYMKLVACLLVSGEHNRTVQFFFPSQVTEENLCDCAFLTMLPSDDLLNFGWTGNNHLPLTTLGKQFAFGIGEKG